MNDRQSKLKAEEVINSYTLAEKGSSYKKKNKKLMRRKQRTILKRDLLKEDYKWQRTL